MSTPSRVVLSIVVGAITTLVVIFVPQHIFDPYGDTTYTLCFLSPFVGIFAFALSFFLLPKERKG